MPEEEGTVIVPDGSGKRPEERVEVPLPIGVPIVGGILAVLAVVASLFVIGNQRSQSASQGHKASYVSIFSQPLAGADATTRHATPAAIVAIAPTPTPQPTETPAPSPSPKSSPNPKPTDPQFTAAKKELAATVQTLHEKAAHKVAPATSPIWGKIGPQRPLSAVALASAPQAPASAEPIVAATPEPTQAPQAPTQVALAPQAAVLDARFQNQVQPDYPEAAQRSNAHGSVTVLATIDSRGKPTVVRVAQSSGSAALDRSAISAARSSTFVPQKVDGKPTVATYRIVYDF